MAYPKELPERYYLSHFHEFLRFFDGPSRALLGEETTQFIEQFLALDEQHPLIQNFVLRTFDDNIQYLLFLYFGHTHGRLNQFSMRDLGIMRTRGEVSSDMARFENAESAQAAYYYAN